MSLRPCLRRMSATSRNAADADSYLRLPMHRRRRSLRFDAITLPPFRLATARPRCRLGDTSHFNPVERPGRIRDLRPGNPANDAPLRCFRHRQKAAAELDVPLGVELDDVAGANDLILCVSADRIAGNLGVDHFPIASS